MRYPFAMPLLWFLLWVPKLYAQNSSVFPGQRDQFGSFYLWTPIWWVIFIMMLLLLVAGIWMILKLKNQGQKKNYPKLLRKKGDIYLFIDSRELSRELIDLVKDEILEQRQNGHESPLKVIVPSSNSEHEQTQEDETPNLSEEEEQLVNKMYSIIEDQVSNANFSINDLCKKLGMSHSQLHRKSKALTGLAPSQLIKSIKIEKAKELLKKPELTITAIAYDSGFTDPAYFHRVFKQEVGLTPKQFRDIDQG